MVLPTEHAFRHQWVCLTNVPDTLEKAINLAQRFEDAKPAQDRPPAKEQAKPAARTNISGSKSANDVKNGNSTTFCGYCKKKKHTEDVCRKKARDTAAPDSGLSKKWPGSVGWQPNGQRTVGDSSSKSSVASKPAGKRKPRKRERLAYQADILYCYLDEEARIDTRSVR
ncbi:hypothetical protein PC129_g24555 [Phytophthora cactorum]|uniref:Uncharacterized protein n=1 Tax=Phytophthora cactorum TaxID=29920 RepID=A0A8T0ZZ53_9STRA|nr:hypothetical protein Pcac1_g13626 [Phytophthora cactorum]KAG2846023.1 hypothetical protein PC112_g1623 [Phytophthora cactorum]KAG2867469.1 hypothetical protein PC113_g1909 [Phytophthora cactorum]KAG2931965.1 hypothetical protein PC114_g1994 [Phytophthora cactorum]KAG2953790.1 hypothetical protein PC117_g1752 [Phytophthora cactorum]